jgi:hypothetical protein
VGPYETEEQALAEPMPREVAALHDAGLVRTGDPDRLVRNAVWRHLAGSCEAAGVVLGTFDRRTLDWLCGWEPSTAQVLIGVVTRAHVAGVAVGEERARPGSKQDDALFAQHAALEAIEAELRRATATRSRWDRRVAWLTALRVQRIEQVQAGTWPPAAAKDGGS